MMLIYIFMAVNMSMANRGAEFLKAMGERTRFMILRALAGGERCACEIPKLVRRSQPTVSLQLAHLARHGLLRCRRDGKKRIYSIADVRVRKVFDVLGE